MTEEKTSVEQPINQPTDYVCPKCGCDEISGGIGNSHGMDVWIEQCEMCGHIVDIDYV